MSSTSRKAVVGAALAMFVATLLWRLLTFTGFSNDHYGHLALAQQLLLGDRPIRDFSDPGWPLTYLISAAAWWLAGNALGVEWAVTALALASAAALTVVAAYRLSGSLAIAVLVAAVEIVIYPRTYAYPKILPYAALAAVLVFPADTLLWRRLVFLGMLIAAAFLLRHDHGLWTGIAALAYIAFVSRREGVEVAVSRAVIVAGTAFVVLLPWLVFVAVNGGLFSYFATALEFARAEANASMLRSWPRFAAAAGAGIGDVVAANDDAWLFYLFWALPAASALLVLRRYWRGHERWPGELAAVAALTLLAVCVNAGFLRDVLRTRLADAIVPTGLLAAWLLGACWTSRWPRPAAQRLAQLTAALVVVVSLAAVGSVSEFLEQVERSGIDNGLGTVRSRFVQRAHVLREPHRQDWSVPSRVSAALMPFFRYLGRCSSPADRLIVTGEFPDVLVLAGRRFAGDGVVFGAWYSSVARQGRTLEQLREHPALFVIPVDEEPFRERFPVIASHLDEHYEPFATLEGDGVAVPILVDRRRTPSGSDTDTDWPCYF